MKPTALLEQLIKDGSPRGGIILDPFAGSGSTIIAGQNARRKVYAMEIEPYYIDVAVKRYAGLLGSKDVYLIRDGEKYAYDEIMNEGATYEG